jgi:hypothetical protein
MPATIPAHPAAVLPLKLIRPRRFDGVALVVGAMAPDIPHAFAGLGVWIPSHTWHSLFWFNVPVTLAIAALVRRAAPHVAANLPAGGPLALRDYGVLASVRHPLGVTALSALIGALSHQLWDTVTHPYILMVHPFLGGETYLPAMHRTAVAGLPWWRVIQILSEIVGAAVTAAVAVHIGRKRLLVAWHGPAPGIARRATLFWLVAGGVATVGVAVAVALPGASIGPNVIGTRVIGALALGLFAGAATTAAANRAPEDTHHQEPTRPAL